MELNRKEKKIIKKLLNGCESLFEDMVEEVGGEYDYGFSIQDLRDLCKKFGATEIPASEWKKNIQYEKEALDERKR